ncbi:hypothetical protein ABNQ39_37020 (plasmid) [Azospirillum sp. A26]|uniref:hypothetical protein n=1 Tax=Azospirillum sp. A26 TaxID=3160607 RepID=UPI00366F18FE
MLTGSREASMPKPQYSSRTAAQGYLTRDQVMCVLTADPDTGEVRAPGAELPPDWLLEECQDLGLVTPGEKPCTWKLSPDGWDARVALLSD